MNRNKHLTQNDLQKIRGQLSEELGMMSSRQKKEYLKAAENVYDGLTKMAKIRQIVRA